MRKEKALRYSINAIPFFFFFPNEENISLMVKSINTESKCQLWNVKAGSGTEGSGSVLSGGISSKDNEVWEKSEKGSSKYPRKTGCISSMEERKGNESRHLFPISFSFASCLDSYFHSSPRWFPTS